MQLKKINWKIIIACAILFILVLLISIKAKAMESLKKNIDPSSFYKKIRTNLFKTLSQSQVDGLNNILSHWTTKYANQDKRFLAYILATVYHETAKTMQPIEEFGKGNGRAYGGKVKMNGKKYTTPNQLYYGRGYVQITWYENYEKFGKILNINLLENPNLALNKSIATSILFIGMFEGLFTGKKLSDYFNLIKNDYVNARRIVNGTDKANLIAGYATEFFKSLN